jgi:hypothetical protein
MKTRTSDALFWVGVVTAMTATAALVTWASVAEEEDCRDRGGRMVCEQGSGFTSDGKPAFVTTCRCEGAREDEPR